MRLTMMFSAGEARKSFGTGLDWDLIVTFVTQKLCGCNYILFEEIERTTELFGESI